MSDIDLIQRLSMVALDGEIKNSKLTTQVLICTLIFTFSLRLLRTAQQDVYDTAMEVFTVNLWFLTFFLFCFSSIF